LELLCICLKKSWHPSVAVSAPWSRNLFPSPSHSFPAGEIRRHIDALSRPQATSNSESKRDNVMCVVPQNSTFTGTVVISKAAQLLEIGR